VLWSVRAGGMDHHFTFKITPCWVTPARPTWWASHLAFGLIGSIFRLVGGSGQGRGLGGADREGGWGERAGKGVGGSGQGRGLGGGGAIYSPFPPFPVPYARN
jgi:hypothetical protein